MVLVRDEDEADFWSQVDTSQYHWIFPHRYYNNEESQRFAWKSIYGDPGSYFVLGCTQEPFCVRGGHLYIAHKDDYVYVKRKEGGYLLDEDIEHIFFLSQNKILRQAEIERMYGISHSQLWRLRRGQRRKNIRDKWEKEYGPLD